MSKETNNSRSEDEFGRRVSDRQKLKRTLTPFLCREMLYDYMMGYLDEDRALDVRAYLESHSDSQSELSAMKKASDYLTMLSEAEFREQVIEELKDSENAFSLGRRFTTWSAWPESLRWTVIAIGISASLAGVIGVLPWQSLESIFSTNHKLADMVELPVETAQQLAELEESGDLVQENQIDLHHDGEETELPAGHFNIDGGDEEEVLHEASGDSIHIADHGGDEDLHNHLPTDGSTTLPPFAVGQNIVPKAENLLKIQPSIGNSVLSTGSSVPLGTPNSIAGLKQKPESPSENGTPTNSPSLKSGSQPDSSEGEVTTNAATRDEKKPEFKPKGFVYRAFMTLSNLEAVGDQIASDIKELGGTKAGEVELGWRRGTGRYYHFSLPEANEETILEKLRAFGPVRISKDPHPRVMPQGQVRFILWIESSDQ